ncbi:hypothetical protein KY304_01480 [Candidatus Woesearchaeota archaeon]|nr:hypothetical protein [Candidatus Woesearchaeota archaeon]
MKNSKDDFIIDQLSKLEKTMQREIEKTNRIVVQEQTVLGKITGYRKPNEKYKMYWNLISSKGNKIQFWTIQEDDPDRIPSLILQQMSEAIFEKYGI